MKDRLEEIFEMQSALNLKIGVDAQSMQGNPEEMGRWILQYSRALGQETAELVDCVPWKWWAKYQKFDLQNARVELVDILHFVVSLAQVMGLSADDLHKLYLGKHRVNVGRQDEGYTSKDPGDCSKL